MADLVSKDQRELIFKQRRLLLTLTFILTAIHAADVTLGDSIPALGVVGKVGKPWVVVAGLWVAWAYSLYR